MLSEKEAKANLRQVKSRRKRVKFVTLMFRIVLSSLNALFIFVHVTVRHRELVPKTGPVLVVANHESTFDPIPLFGSMRRNVAFLAAAGLFRSKLLGWLMRWMGHIPVQRGTAAAIESLEFAEAVLHWDQAVGMFPEGKTSNQLIPAKFGAAKLAFKTGVLVVPVGLIGTRKVKPRGKMPRLLLRRVRINYGPGFRAPRVTSEPTQAELVAFNRQMMDLIADLSSQPRLPVQAGEI